MDVSSITRRIALAGGTAACTASARARRATIYSNALASAPDIAGFKLEGEARATFPNGRLRLENALPVSEAQRANFVLWCPEIFPDNIRITWKFWPLREPGLAMLFFAARGQNGAPVLDRALAPRRGLYDDYIRGDIRALHVSYFRRKEPEERAFNVCNLRKTPGFHLVAQGADPIPAVTEARPPYSIEVLKQGPRVRFAINDLVLFDWRDDGTRGPILGDGGVGFRQLAPLAAEYSDFRVERAAP